MDQNPQIHLHTVQQPPSITSRCFSCFSSISWAAVDDPKQCLLLAKSHWQTQELNKDKPHLQRDTGSVSSPCHEPTHTSTASSAGEGESSVFTQTLRALDTEEMEAGFLAEKPAGLLPQLQLCRAFARRTNSHTFKSELPSSSQSYPE